MIDENGEKLKIFQINVKNQTKSTTEKGSVWNLRIH